MGAVIQSITMTLKTHIKQGHTEQIPWNGSVLSCLMRGAEASEG